MQTLIAAARAVIRQRDHYADHLTYAHDEPGPKGSQCFDDWAADILAEALIAEGVDEPMVDTGETVHTKRLDEARKEMVDALVEDRIARSPHAGELRWYVREHYENLNDVDLQQEFNDAGLGDA